MGVASFIARSVPSSGEMLVLAMSNFSMFGHIRVNRTIAGTVRHYEPRKSMKRSFGQQIVVTSTTDTFFILRRSRTSMFAARSYPLLDI